MATTETSAFERAHYARLSNMLTVKVRTLLLSNFNKYRGLYREHGAGVKLTSRSTLDKGDIDWGVLLRCYKVKATQLKLLLYFQVQLTEFTSVWLIHLKVLWNRCNTINVDSNLQFDLLVKLILLSSVLVASRCLITIGFQHGQTHMSSQSMGKSSPLPAWQLRKYLSRKTICCTTSYATMQFSFRWGP